MMKKTKLESLLASADMTVKQAMRKIESTGEGILFVIDNKKALIGTVTDGDIRRGLIRGVNFGDAIDKVMSQEFVLVRDDDFEKKEKARAEMLKTEIERIPVVTENGHIVDVISWTDMFGERKFPESRSRISNPVVIMAGGKGSRLDPFTKILPKPLIPVGEKTILELIMEKFHGYGFCNFLLVLNYKKEYIKMFLSENEFPYNIECVEEHDYRGTIGGLSLLKDKIQDTFFVSNCDIIVEADYSDVLSWHVTNGNLMTLIGCHKEINIPYGILQMEDERLKSFVEKPNHDVIINTGVYVLEPDAVSLISEHEFMDMDALIESAPNRGKVSVYPISSGYFDFGEWEEYRNSLKKITEV